MSEKSDEDQQPLGRPSFTREQLQYQDSLDQYQSSTQNENEEPNQQISANKSGSRKSGSQKTSSAKMNKSKSEESLHQLSSVRIPQLNLERSPKSQVLLENESTIIDGMSSLNYNDKPFPRQITSPQSYTLTGFVAGSPIRVQPGGTTPVLVPSLNNVNRYLGIAHSNGLAGATGRSGSGCGIANYAPAQNLNDSVSTINHSLNSFSVYNVGSGLGTGQVPGVTGGANPSPVHINELKREMRKKEQDFHKQTALLKQQVQLLELQTKEFEQREGKLKRMHESMLKAVQEGSNQNGRQSVTPNQALKDEFEETINHQQTKMEAMKEEIKQLKFQQQNQTLQMEEKEIESERKVQDLQLDKRNLENKIKRMENQISQARTSDQVLAQMTEKDSELAKVKDRLQQQSIQTKQDLEKFKSCNDEILRQKECQQKQIDFLQEQTELKEQQKQTSHGRVIQLEDQVKSYEMQVEEMEQQLDEMTQVIQQKDSNIQHMQQSLDFNSSFDLTGAVRNNGATSGRSNLQIQRLADENEYLQVQIGSHQETIKNQQEQIVKYQNSENFIQNDLAEKQQENTKLQKQMDHLAQQLNAADENEQKVHTQEKDDLKAQLLKFKSQFEEAKNLQQRQLDEKDHDIERLTSILEKNNQKSIHQSPIRLQNMSTLVASRDFQLSLQGMQYIGNNLKPAPQNISQLSGVLPLGAQQAPLKSGPVPQDSTLDNSSQHFAKEECNNTLNLNTSHQFSQYRDQNFQTTGDSMAQMIYGPMGQQIMPGNLGIGVPMAGDDAFSHQLIDENGTPVGIYDLPRQQRPAAGNFSNSNIKIDFNNGGCTSASLVQNEETEEEKVQIPVSELDLLQSCQKIIDAASSMKCIRCSEYFQTTDFYDHIFVQEECVAGSDQSSSENIAKPMLPNESNYFDELKKSQQIPDSMIESMDQSKGFYDAINMPLQAKDVSNYQTYTKSQSKNHKEGSNKPLSSPFTENQSKVIQSDSKKSNNEYNQHYTRSNQKNLERESKLKSKVLDIRSRSGGRGGHGSRSGMGCSGTAMTINSHILMSLSRSATSRSNLSEQQSPVQESSKQIANEVNVNKNFHNDTDNIRNLAQNLKEFTDQNLMTDENSFIQNSTDPNNMKESKLENAIGHDEKFNLMSCSDDNDNDENQEQSQNNNDDDMLEEVNSLEEDINMNSKKSYNDPSDPQNILSQSLRDIVNNQVNQNNFGETNTNLNSQQITLQNSANQQNDNEIVEKLEKLYDLDTSRFEEEYSNLPSSKKKILLNRLETDKDNSSKNASRVQDYEGNNTSSVHNFVDISKFNLSHDLTKGLSEDKNLGNPVNMSLVSANSKGKAKIKVVGINLAPMMHKNNKSALGLTMEERAERGKDLPLSLNDSRRKLNGTALGGSGQNQINFFPKPSPKYQDDDITSGGMKALRGATGEFSQLISAQGIVSLRPSSSAAAMNTSKLSAFDNSQSSLNHKPKFDLSKQINEINQKKLAREKSKTKEKVVPITAEKKVVSTEVPAAGSSLKKAKSQSSSKHILKKPVLNIEIEDTYYEEEENMNKPLQIEGLGLQVPGQDGTLQDQLASQKNVMESFRNYQNKMMQQTAGLGTADLNQQFQSVSSKNGTQNFDFAAVTGGGSAQPKHGNSHGQQPSSRRHAHGTNRYNQNGFMMVTSSSLNSDQPGEAQECEQEVMQLPLQLQSHQSQISKSSLQVEPQKLFENHKGKPILSPAKPTSTGKYQEDKTIEQNVNLRQMSQKYSKRGQEMQRSGQLTDRRMDTSGVDINWGSELNSPQRMNIPQNQTKAMKNLRAGGRFLQINEEDKSDTDGLKMGDSQLLLDEEQDEMGDLEDFEKANAIEGAAGFQSHRHQLGKQVVGLKPTLMSKVDTASFDLQATKRDPAMQSCSDKQLVELRKQLLNSQLSQAGRAEQQINHPPQLVSQGTVMTDELLQNYERERLLSVGSRGNFKLQTQQQVPQQHLQKASPKNSDYIKQSILLQSGGKSGKSKKLPANIRNRASNFLEQEECPSFFDEFEFDEDHPIANQKLELQQNFQSTAPQHSSKDMKLENIEKEQQRPITQKNQATRKDPLKNSLFHSFMLTQRNQPGGANGNAFLNGGSKKMAIGKSYLRSYRENAEDQMSLNQFKTNRSVFQNMHSSRSNQFSIIDNQYSTQNIHEHVEHPTILQGAVQPNSSAGGAASGGAHSRPGTNMLQKHMIQTTTLQRSRSNTKKQNIDQLAFNQSLGVINRPMMSNALHISQSNVMETSQNLSSRSGVAAGQNHQIQQSQIQSATKVNVEAPDNSISQQQQQSWSHGNLLARKQSQQELVMGTKPGPLVQMKQ